MTYDDSGELLSYEDLLKQKEELRQTLREAWDLVVQQPQVVLDAIAKIVMFCRKEKNWDSNGEDSWCYLDAEATLRNLSDNFSKMKTIHDPFNVMDPF